MPGLIPLVDHLVYAAPALDPAVAHLESLLGVRASPGGQHPGEGTRNAIIPLGPAVYLEIVAPDPSQPSPPRPRWFGIDALAAPRLATWAAKGTRLEELVLAALQLGLPLGRVRSGSRRRPDGAILTWQLTDPVAIADGIVPFFIDWGASPHPAGTAPREIALIGLRAEHPDGDRIEAQLLQLGMDLEVSVRADPALIATLETPRGRVELR
ncbi:MAG: VOC family protein [Gemmatimonadales bacterium]